MCEIKNRISVNEHTTSDETDTELPGGFFATAPVAAVVVGGGVLGTVSTGLDAVYLMKWKHYGTRGSK